MAVIPAAPNEWRRNLGPNRWFALLREPERARDQRISAEAGTCACRSSDPLIGRSLRSAAPTNLARERALGTAESRASGWHGPRDRFHPPGRLASRDRVGDFRLSRLSLPVARVTSGRAQARPLSSLESCPSATCGGLRIGGDHRCRSFMDGGDDLGVVDPPQVTGGDGQVGMPKLSLDHEQRDSLARHLHRVGVSELVGREPASDSGYRGGVVQLSADSGGSAWPPACRAAQDAEQSADR